MENALLNATPKAGTPFAPISVTVMAMLLILSATVSTFLMNVGLISQCSPKFLGIGIRAVAIFSNTLEYAEYRLADPFAMPTFNPSSIRAILPSTVSEVYFTASWKPSIRFIRKLYSPSADFLASLMSLLVMPKDVASVEDAGRMPSVIMERNSCTYWFVGSPKLRTALVPTVDRLTIWSMVMPLDNPGPNNARKVSINSLDVAAVRKASLCNDFMALPDKAMASFHFIVSPFSVTMDFKIPAIPIWFVSSDFAYS